MFNARFLLAACLCLAATRAMLAEDALPPDVEGRLADMEARLNADRQVRPSAYAQNPQQAPPADYARLGVPLPPPAYQPAPAPAQQQGPVLVYPCPPEPVYRPGHWLVGLDVIPTQFILSDAKFGRWHGGNGIAGRLTVGYERADGLGMRGRLWGFGEDASPLLTDVTITASSFNLDVYKRIPLGEGELVLGMGTMGSGLRLELPDESASRFVGGGISLFADGYYPLVHFRKSDLGAVGRGRMSLVNGEWTDTTDFVVPHTEHDMLSIYEVAFGLEFRRRFGRLEDKYWYVGVTEEMQRWDSAWMSRYLASSAGFDGLNINFGLVW